MGATLSPHLQTLVRIAQAAGAVVMRHYEAGCDARVKADRSPVTDADEEAEQLILAELARRFPGVPVVAEKKPRRGKDNESRRAFFPGGSRGRDQGIRQARRRVHREHRRDHGRRTGRRRGAGAGHRQAVRRQVGEGAFEMSAGIDARHCGARAGGRRVGGGVQPLASRIARPTNCL